MIGLFGRSLPSYILNVAAPAATSLPALLFTTLAGSTEVWATAINSGRGGSNHYILFHPDLSYTDGLMHTVQPSIREAAST
ncbi:hypothetical protein F5X96DRAFT_629422 [Biscogniauxia mediterranea]|nr:hypothetical protein F5X96DRAFT_629422 [Biscogniauxia mediterranea]